MTPLRKLPGVLALDGGTCHRCKRPILAGVDRVVFVKGVAIHRDCLKGKEF